jgi:hypothetical protein
MVDIKVESTGLTPTSSGWGLLLKQVLQTIGSLRFAAVLLMLLLVGMACATVYESTTSTERAMVAFYSSWWFRVLLALIGVNVLASVLVRYPFSKRQIGFVVTHTGILLTLAGALVTERFALDGRLGFFEGQTADSFSGNVDALTLTNSQKKKRAAIDLSDPAFKGFEAVERPPAPSLTLGGVTVKVERFLPDSEWVRQVLDDDSRPQPAVEVALSPTGRDDPTWVFAGHPEEVTTLEVSYQIVQTAEELQRWLNPPAEAAAGSKGIVKVEYSGASFDIPLEQAVQQAVPLGATGMSIRVLRYLPHAIVGEDKKLVNASNEPVNPAIEVELTGPAGTEMRRAFAKFPDLQSMHGKAQIEGLKVVFIAPTEALATVGVQICAGPNGELHARFKPEGGDAVTRKLEIGMPVETPWAEQKFAVLRRFEHARIDWTLTPVEPVRKEREPALWLKISAGTHTNEVGIQQHATRPVTIDGVPYELSYEGRRVPLGFQIKLDRFQIGYYPGGMRPRSFESHVTLTDATGVAQSHVVSMNHPLHFGGFSLYQSSYRQEKGKSASFLSVSRDPGQPIVFAGYIVMLVGMAVVLTTRIVDRQAVERSREA